MPVLQVIGVSMTMQRVFVSGKVQRVGYRDWALATGQRRGAAMAADCGVVAGGSDVYAQALPLADRLELTFVHAQPQGDAEDIAVAVDRLEQFHDASRDAHRRLGRLLARATR